MGEEFRIYFKYLLKRCEDEFFNDILNNNLDFNVKDFLKNSLEINNVDGLKYQEIEGKILEAFFITESDISNLIVLHTKLCHLSSKRANIDFNIFMEAEMAYREIQKFLGLKVKPSTLLKNNPIYSLL